MEVWQWHAGTSRNDHTRTARSPTASKSSCPPDPLTGTRQTRTGTFRTKKEAEKEAVAWVSEADSGLSVKPSKLTLLDVSKQWLDLRRPDVKPRTMEHYENTLMVHVGKYIGQISVQRVQPVTIDALYA
jgi:integrase-like protein